MPDRHDPPPLAGGRRPMVVHCRRAPLGSFALVDRSTVFGNPFPLTNPDSTTERAEVIDQYRAYFLARVERDPVFRAQVETLRGRDLGCWCAPRPCHAQVILDWLASHPPAQQPSPPWHAPAGGARHAGAERLVLDEPRVLVCGSREWVDPGLVWAVLDHLHDRYQQRLVIVEGCAPRGADAAAHAWCVRQRLARGSRHRCHPAAWDAYPPSQRWRAGHDRNTRMFADRPQLVVAFHDALAPDLGAGGTADSLLKATLLSVPAYLIRGRALAGEEGPPPARPRGWVVPTAVHRAPQGRAHPPAGVPLRVLGSWFARPAEVPARRLTRAQADLRVAHLLPPAALDQPDHGLAVE